MSLIELEFVVRQDPWGMTASSSIIGELLMTSADPMWNKNIGEAWCGTHPQRPALIKGTKENLFELISRSPVSVLGEKLYQKNGPSLPFLFKILTINTPLSIQVHPNQNKARELSSRSPERYKDQSEKPEIGVAIRDTKLLLGFRPVAEIIDFIKRFPPAVGFFSKELARGSVEEIYKKLLVSTESEIQFLNTQIFELLKIKTNLVEEEELFLKLFSIYPNDSGVFQVFLLNLVTLNPGEGVFIPPDTVHAYLSGQLLECMATSDFVIRAGLTNKEKDVSSLLEVVRYENFEVVKNTPSKSDSEFSPYLTPTKQFKFQRLNGSVSKEVVQIGSPILYFCLRGSGQISLPNSNLELAPGSICLVYSDTSHVIRLSGEFYKISVELDS